MACFIWKALHIDEMNIAFHWCSYLLLFLYIEEVLSFQYLYFSVLQMTVILSIALKSIKSEVLFILYILFKKNNS